MKGLLFANREALGSKESRKGPSQPAFSLSMPPTRDEQVLALEECLHLVSNLGGESAPNPLSAKAAELSLRIPKEKSVHLGPLRRDSQAERVPRTKAAQRGKARIW